MTCPGCTATHVAGFAAGAAVVSAVFLSAVSTVVVPRGVPVRLTRIVFRSMRRLFAARSRFASTYEARDRAMALYAPLTLIVLPVVWLAITLLGFTAMFWALGVHPLRRALVTSGSSLLTLGFAQVPDLPTTVLAFAEATIGLILLALLITFLPSIYGAFSRREHAVAMVTILAGSPPGSYSTPPPSTPAHLTPPGVPRPSCASAAATWRCEPSATSTAFPTTPSRPRRIPSR